MSGDSDLASDKAMQDIIRETVEGNKSPASVELIGQVYSDLVTVRDVAISLFELVANPNTDKMSKINEIADSLHQLQDGIGRGLRLLGRDAFGEDDE